MSLGMYIGITGAIIFCTISVISMLWRTNNLLVEILTELKKLNK